MSNRGLTVYTPSANSWFTIRSNETFHRFHKAIRWRLFGPANRLTVWQGLCVSHIKSALCELLVPTRFNPRIRWLMPGCARLLPLFCLSGLAAMFVYRISLCEADVDMWHEMAWAREAVSRGEAPWEDCFAYTPTLSPCVHHEWGAGMIAYCLATHGGGAAIVAAKFLLALSLAVVCWKCARRRGASFATLGFLAPVAIMLSDDGFSTIRAQVYSFLFCALLLYWLDRDREGSRRWIGIWLLVFVCWLNLHAGFLVGAGLWSLHALEQWRRGQPHAHLAAAGVLMIPLVAVNPYGLAYCRYLWRAVTLERPLVKEWAPLWESGHVPHISLFVLAAILLGYTVRQIGVARFPGLPIILITALYAAAHQRMLPFFAAAWICYLPAALEGTPLGQSMRKVWINREPALTAIWGLTTAGMALLTMSVAPWQLRVPGSAKPAERGAFVYPVGAVAYLAETSFQGNLMTPFDHGAYVLWKLHPQVKVSMDSRYEVAYPPEAAQENYAFYHAHPGWQETLARHSTHAVLVPRWSRLDQILGKDDSPNGGKRQPEWRRVYQDDCFSLFFSAALTSERLLVDRTGEPMSGSFP